MSELASLREQIPTQFTIERDEENSMSVTHDEFRFEITEVSEGRFRVISWNKSVKIGGVGSSEQSSIVEYILTVTGDI